MKTTRQPTLVRFNDHLDSLDETVDHMSRDVVDKFLIDERANHPADLADLANAMVGSYLTGTATDRFNKWRAKARMAARSGSVDSFAQALAAAGDDTPRLRLSMFSAMHVVDKENTRRSVGQMTGADHRYVARQYTADARVSQMEAAFHKAVAKKVGNATTADVMDEETYSALYRSIVNPGQSDAA